MKNCIYLYSVVYGDFIDYKKPSLLLNFPYCNMKCNFEYNNCMICKCNLISKNDIKEFDIDTLMIKYDQNPELMKAVVMSGLEPMDSFGDVLTFIKEMRETYSCYDDVVIYTGYNKNELNNKIELLKLYPNIIIKFGRYIPDNKKHFDELLGIELSSDNQYAEKIS